MVLLPRFRRHDRLAPERLATLMRYWLPAFDGLRTDERSRLAELTDALIRELHWEAANGFSLTEEMPVAVAVNAALLVLGFDDGIDSYRSVTSVIIHPSTIMLHGTRSVGGAMVTDAAEAVLGETHHNGPILISWDAARHQARNPQFGENVLFHEFAHRLDMLDKVGDGTPRLADPDKLREWVNVCTAAFDRVCSTGSTVLQPYAATNPTEFFAVATEVFFTRPAVLHEQEPALYCVLRDYYRQDPAAR